MAIACICLFQSFHTHTHIHTLIIDLFSKSSYSLCTQSIPPPPLIFTSHLFLTPQSLVASLPSSFYSYPFFKSHTHCVPYQTSLFQFLLLFPPLPFCTPKGEGQIWYLGFFDGFFFLIFSCFYISRFLKKILFSQSTTPIYSPFFSQDLPYTLYFLHLSFSFSPFLFFFYNQALTPCFSPYPFFHLFIFRKPLRLLSSVFQLVDF